MRLIGPESQQRAQTDGRTVYGVYTEEGIDDLEFADKDPTARINRITMRLRPHPGHENPTGAPPVPCYDHEGNVVGEGAPTLYFFNNLTYTNEHFPQYRWRPTRPNYLDEEPPEKPRKKNDHTVDNCGHVLVSIGDSVPDVPDNSKLIHPEDKWLYDHFETEMAQAIERTTGNAWHPRKREVEAA